MTNYLNSKNFQRLGYRQLPVLLGLLIALFSPISSFAHGQGDSISANAKTLGVQKKSRAENLTLQLSQMINAYHGAENAAEKSGLEEKLTALAEERRQLLLEFMGLDPAAVMRLALPKELKEGLPPDIEALLEKKAEIEGELKVIYEDYEKPEMNRTLFFLESPSGKKVSLRFSELPQGLMTGSQVRVKGAVIFEKKPGEDEVTEGVMAVDTGENNILFLAPDGSGGGASSASSSALPNTTGEQRTLVLLVNFQNAPMEPWTIQDAMDLVFGEVNDFYLENSFGQTWLTGEVHGWYTLPFDQPTDSSNCKASDVASYAQQAAQNDGVNLSQFNRYIYVFPQTSCFPSGSGTVGGSPSEAWINGNWFILKTVGHELGHNLGLYHSGALECGDVAVGTDCNVFVYGDKLDIMGNSSTGHFNTFQKERLGWLDPGLGDVVEVETDGTYTLEAYETNDFTSHKGVKVLKGVDPVTGDKTWYYLEYRQDIGFDAFLADNQNVLNGLVVHKAIDSDPTSSLLLDMTPNSLSYGDWGDPALPFGQTFSDADSGVIITSLGGDGSTATIDVSFDSSGCVRSNPVVTFTPADIQWVDAGTVVDYTINLTNEDNAACGSSDFDLQANIPADWSSAFANPFLTVLPGLNANTILTVTSPAVEASGIYDIVVTAVNSADAAYSGSATASYGIQGSGNQAPNAVEDNASTNQDTPVIIDVLANDWDDENDPLTVVSVTQGANGTVSINADGTITHSPKRKFKGEDNFTYTVSDGYQTSTANVTVTVNRSGGGGSKGGGKGGKPSGK